MVGVSPEILELATVRWDRITKVERYRDDPALWAKDIAGIKMWSAQREFAESVRDNRATAVAAGHGVGKTFGMALVACWWVDTHPVRDVFVASTAPTQSQVSLLWDNIRTIKALIEERYERGIIDHKLPGYIDGKNAWKLDDGFKIGEGRKPPDQKSDVAFQGRHAPYLLAIADEAVGVPGGFLEALGNIATGRRNRQCLIANPTDPSCAMARIWKENDPQWVRLHISVFDAPTMKPEEGFDPDEMADRGMAGQEYIDQKLQEYGGEDDPRYISRVLGQWAFDAGNNIFTPEEMARGFNTRVVCDPDALPQLGVDVARMGPDASVIYAATWGEVWEDVLDEETGEVIGERPTGKRGIQLRWLADWRRAPITGNNPDNPGSAQRVHEHALASGTRMVAVDATGIGGPLLDGLAEIGRTQVLPYHWAEIFAGTTRGVDTRTYINARAYFYFEMKRMLREGELDIDFGDATLKDQLESMIFEYDSKGRIKIESKDDMRRHGKKSPDYADAAWYALVDVDRILGSLPAGRVEIRPDSDMQLQSASPNAYGRPV